MENENDLALFDVDDNTALVCIDHQQYQQIVVPQLIDMNFKVHLGLYEEDVLVKLRTYAYNVVVIYENFKGSTIATNPILKEMTRRAGSERRQHFVVLLTHCFATNDAMCAFVHSVDQIINVADLTSFKPVIRRGTTQHREMYHPFQSTLKTVESM